MVGPKKYFFTVISCGTPPTPINIETSMTSGLYGDAVTYDCINGYWVQQHVYNLTTTCMENASWIPVALTDCKSKMKYK